MEGVVNLLRATGGFIKSDASVDKHLKELKVCEV